MSCINEAFVLNDPAMLGNKNILKYGEQREKYSYFIIELPRGSRNGGGIYYVPLKNINSLKL